MLHIDMDVVSLQQLTASRQTHEREIGKYFNTRTKQLSLEPGSVFNSREHPLLSSPLFSQRTLVGYLFGEVARGKSKVAQERIDAVSRYEVDEIARQVEAEGGETRLIEYGSCSAFHRVVLMQLGRYIIRHDRVPSSGGLTPRDRQGSLNPGGPLRVIECTALTPDLDATEAAKIFLHATAGILARYGSQTQLAVTASA